MIQLSGLSYYPIKSCRGFDLREARVERMGLENDRRLMLVTPDGDFLTQRKYAKLALVTPTLQTDSVTLSAPNFETLKVDLQKRGAIFPVNIWKSAGVHAIDQGEEAAQWFSDWLGVQVRLVHFAEGYIRKVNADFAINEDDHTGFADGYPILIISEEALQDLNSKLDAPLPMKRFRPNIVVSGCEPFAEDRWKRIRIGAIELALVKPCARCAIPTIDPETLATSKEPLKTLETYRRHPLGAIFGMNAIPLNGGKLEVGMNVEVLS
ncbi:MAG: MOSC domain-containing protein [Anaerolineales bacterium]|nr:MOSC domain-containing protein [Anaerolineales bacterium]MCZ2122623.1 MOSC domain-containing protein [Anaerolineales bacterium]